MNTRNLFKSGFLRAALMLTLAVMTFPLEAWANVDVDYLYYDTTNKKFKKSTQSAEPLSSTSNNLSGWYYASETVTIDNVILNGDTHIILCDDAQLIITTIGGNNKSLSFYAQSTGIHEGTIDVRSTSSTAIDNVIDFTIHGGKVSAATNTESKYAVNVRNDFTIYGGQLIAAANGNNGKAIFISGNMIVNDGQVTATANGNDSYAISSSGNLNVNGGKLTATVVGEIGTAVKFNNAVINGGQVEANNSSNGYGIDASGNITLGWTNATDFIQASSYIVRTQGTVKTAEGKSFLIYDGETAGNIISGTVSNLSTINGKTLRPAPVATVTTAAGTEFFVVDATYTTDAAAFQAAVTAANDATSDVTVKLYTDVDLGTADVTFDNTHTIGEGQSARPVAITLDLNGKTLSGSYSQTNTTQVVSVNINTSLVITNSGSGGGMVSDHGRCISNFGTLTLNGAATFTINEEGAYASILNCGTLTLNGTPTFTSYYGINNRGTLTLNGAATFTSCHDGIENYGTLTLNALPIFGTGEDANDYDIYLSTNKTIEFGSDFTFAEGSSKIKIKSYNASPYTFTSSYGTYLKTGDNIIDPADVFVFDYIIEGCPYSASFRLVDANDSKEVQAYLPLYAYIDENGKLHDDLDGSTETTDDDGHAATVLTGGGATTLPGGWYVVNNYTEGVDAAYTGTLQFTGDAHIILCDGSAMTVGTSGSPISDDAIYGYNISGTANINIYGQSTDAATMGSLTACGTKIGIYSRMSSSVTINGGRVIVTGKDQDGISADNGLTINGGWVEATGGSNGMASPTDPVIINGGQVEATGGTFGIFSVNGEVTINGGQVTATGGTNGNGISANGDITLGWTNATDFILASSYCVSGSHSVKIPADKYLYYVDNNTIVLGNATDDYVFGAQGIITTLDDIKNKPLRPAMYFSSNQCVDICITDGCWNLFGSRKAYAVTGYDTATGTVTLSDALAGVPEGVPVILVPHPDFHDITLTVASSTEEAEAIQNNVPTNKSSLFTVGDGVKTMEELIAAATGTSGATGEYMVFTLEGGVFRAASFSDASVPAAGKCFLVVSKWDVFQMTRNGVTPSSASGARGIPFDLGETTGINLTPSPSPKGEGSEYWYSLDGRKLDKAPTKKGVYVRNGVKVIIK